MNVLIIPSWYPNEASPLSGIFTQEQAEAIVAIKPEVNLFVSKWGHDFSALSVREPWKWPKKIWWAWTERKNLINKRNDVYEVFNAKLNWSKSLPLGGIQQLIEVNHRNFNLIQKKFGKIDLIHAHVSYPAGYIASILSREFDVPYIITEHMSPFPFPSLMKNDYPIPEISQAFNQASTTIAVSKSLADRIASFGYLRPQVIPNLVDERIFNLEKPASKKTIFFTLCGITAQKGIDHLLEAIALWNPSAEDFEFRIGGSGPMLHTYQAQAKELGICKLVKWLGHINRVDAPNLFQQCHIYVMPSRHETFGVVYAEAIACGKPIIATRCGGPESIVNENNGKLVDVGNIQDLSNTMREMSNKLEAYDPKIIREDFEERFSRKAIASQILNLYENVLADNTNIKKIS